MAEWRCLRMFCGECWEVHLQGCWETRYGMVKVRFVHRFARRDVEGPERLGGGPHEGVKGRRTIVAEWGC